MTFTVPHTVASSKNRRQLFSRGRGRRVVSKPSEKAQSDMREVAVRARIAANGVEFHADDALRLEYEHDVDTDELLVTVTKIGELPTKGKRGTRCDVHGMMETIADALQGVLYPDDSAIDRFAGGRCR